MKIKEQYLFIIRYFAKHIVVCQGGLKTNSMEQTYGQLKENNGVHYKYEDFEKEVARRLKQYVLVKLKPKHAKLCRKLFRQGYTVADTVGMLILNS